MKQSSLIAIVAVAVLIAGAAVWLVRGAGDEAPQPRAERRTAVVVAAAAAGPVEDRVEAIGTIRPDEQVAITAESG